MVKDKVGRGRPSKKQQILDAALILFAERGYQGSSVDLVVQRAGVSKPTVYNNFPTKLSLWQSSLEQILEGAEKQREALVKKVEGDALDRILVVFSELGRNPKLKAMYSIMLGEQYKMDAPICELFNEYERRLKQWCAEQLRKDGLDVSVTQLFVLVAICREGLLFPALTNRPTAPVDELRKVIECL